MEPTSSTDNPLSFTELMQLSQQNLAMGASLSFADIIVGITASLICSLIIAYIYRSTYQGVMYQKSFAISLVLASLITTMIIMVISGNLVLSLGMVGALSIVRFRSAVKDPLDIIFMFWAISVGIANGVANLKVSVTATVVISLAILVLTRLPGTRATKILIVRTQPDLEAAITNHLSQKSSRFKLKSRSQREDYLELIYDVSSKDYGILLGGLSEVAPNIETNLITYNSNLLDV